MLYVQNWKNKIRLGKDHDGGYVIGEGIGQYDCFISAGISDDDSFATDFTKKYNISGHAFDGTISQYPHDNIQMNWIQKNIPNDEFENLLKNHENIFLKMDIEGSEYQWLETTNNLPNIKQMVIEFHDIWKNMHIFNKIIKTHKIIHTHANNYGGLHENNKPNVIEITFIRKEYINDESNETIFHMNNLDMPNNPNNPDVIQFFEPFHKPPT
jgi:hypothetical protein